MEKYNEREKEYIRGILEKMRAADERELRMIWIFARTTVKGKIEKRKITKELQEFH